MGDPLLCAGGAARGRMASAMRIVPASDPALLVVFGDAITEGIRRPTWRIANVCEGV